MPPMYKKSFFPLFSPFLLVAKARVSVPQWVSTLAVVLLPGSDEGTMLLCKEEGYRSCCHVHVVWSTQSRNTFWSFSVSAQGRCSRFHMAGRNFSQFGNSGY